MTLNWYVPLVCTAVIDSFIGMRKLNRTLYEKCIGSDQGIYSFPGICSPVPVRFFFNLLFDTLESRDESKRNQ